MKHFLGRLVERARGTAPRVEPIVAPRFAPAPAAETAAETEAASKSNGEKMSPPPNKSSRLPVAAVKGEPVPPRGDVAEAPIEVTQETLLVPPAIPETPARFVVRQTKIVEREAPRAKSSAIQPVRAHSRAQAPRSLRPLPLRVAPLRPISPDDQPAEPPIVRVTIGRIDVRAAPAPPPPSRKPARDAGPTLTLDAYLKQRKEGAR